MQDLTAFEPGMIVEALKIGHSISKVLYLVFTCFERLRLRRRLYEVMDPACQQGVVQTMVVTL